jgi:branched-chain amino acid transport system permease protein
MSQVLQALFGGLTLGAQYALMALGFSLIFGILRVINFAHGAFYTLGGYLSYYVSVQLGLPFVVGVLTAVVVTGLLGYVFEVVVIERRIDDHLATIVLTLGFGLAITAAMLILFGPQAVAYTFPLDGAIRIGGATVPYGRLIVIGVAALAIALIYALLYRTPVGRALRAMADDRETAVTQGMRPKILFPLAFAIATGIAGLTGALVTPLFSLAPYNGEQVLMVSFLAVILGGLGSLSGAALASLLIGLVESFAGIYLGGTVAPLLLFCLVLVLLVVRPTGLLGREVKHV